MRILHLLSGLEVGGKERQVLQLCQRARARGHTSELLLFDTPFRGTELDFSPGPTPVHFEQRGPGLDLRFAAALAGRVRALAPDILHAHNDTALFYAGLVAARLGRAAPRTCASFHTKPGHDTRKARLATRLAASRLGAVTAVSDELAQVCLRDRWTRRCEVIWNGVDATEFCPEGGDGGWRERLGVGAERLLVAHVGRCDPIKRRRDLLAAARSAADAAPLSFVFVGQGPGRAEFLDELAKLPAELRDHVHALERVEDMPAFLRAVDAFALPSAHEAAPRVLLEAMATGLPIVATAVGGIPTIVGASLPEPPAALLVPPAAPDQLAAALVRLAREPALRAALGARARERVQAFSAEAEWERYAALYDRVLQL